MIDYYRTIFGLVKPYVTTCDVKVVTDLRFVADPRSVEVRCYLKPHEGVSTDTPAEVRMALFLSAQHVISVLVERGFVHQSHPHIVIDGDVSRDPVTGVRMIASGWIELNLLMEDK